MNEYGHRQHSWVKCRVISQLAAAFLMLGFVFMYGLVHVYLPYIDAIKVRTEARDHAHKYIEKVCNNPALLRDLGRHGMEDCARFEKTMQLDINREASIDVLRQFNFCEKGSCMVLSFNAITLLTSFLPIFLLTFFALLFLIVGCIVYKGYQALQHNNELPLTQFMAAAQMMQHFNKQKTY